MVPLGYARRGCVRCCAVAAWTGLATGSDYDLI